MGEVILRSSEEWPGHPSYVLLFDKIWAQANPDLAARVVKAHIVAEQWIWNALADPSSENYADLINEGIQISNKSAKVVEDAL